MDSLDTTKSLTDQWSQVKHMWLTSFTWDNEYFSKLIQSLDEGHFLKMVVVMQMRTHFFITWSHDIFKRGSKVVLLIVIWRWPGHVSEGSRIIIIVTCVTNFSIVFIFLFFFNVSDGFRFLLKNSKRETYQDVHRVCSPALPVNVELQSSANWPVFLFVDCGSQS